jgi:hypothetical protein
MGFMGQCARQHSQAAHVRFGSKADIEARPFDVRFIPKSGHQTALASRRCLAMFTAIRRASSLLSSLGERLAVVVALPDDG